MIKNFPRVAPLLVSLALGGVVNSGQVLAAKLEGVGLLKEKCASCHAVDTKGALSRISGERKTPEGWEMTIFRMRHHYGVSMTDGEVQSAIKHLADHQGLAPDETREWRYVLERENNHPEKFNAVDRPDGKGIAKQCAVCHSYARVALQRRDEREWNSLIHFHVAQYPSSEYVGANRSSPYWQELSTKYPAILANQFPLNADSWNKWRKTPKSDLSGEWRIVGHLPGAGFYSGIKKIHKIAPDKYETTYTIDYADGRRDEGRGSGVVYTGYEWRGSASHRNEDVREVFEVSKDGNEFTGRWYNVRHDELGGRTREVKIRNNVSQVLAVSPSSIRVGERTRVTIYGVNLKGAPDFGASVKVDVVSRGDHEIAVDVIADQSAGIGGRSVTVGQASTDASVMVFKKYDSVRVEPEHALSRLGDGGGKVGNVMAQFEAVAYLDGPDGKSGTTDDIRIGVVPAAWKLEPWDEQAKSWEDEKYAGRIYPNGLFIPAPAGMNLTRKSTPNNTGNLKVVATVNDHDRKVEGSAQCVVTTAVLWINPPIK